ncbi:MAG: OprO/OprP family phosphate-selective porin [Planctomycetota bacterium]|jgi:phosphate-selective porin OprO/OprP
MNLLWRTPLGLLLASIAFASPVQAETADTSLDREVEHYLENNSGQAAEPNSFRAYWKSGIRMDSADGNFKIAFGGRVMFDMNFADSDDGLGGDLGENKVGFRRARLYVSGTIYKNTVFKAQFDFAKGDQVALKDVYIGLKNVGPGTLLFGHMKEPFGLNEMTSSRYITFTERAASSQSFAPARNPGIGYFSALGDNKQFYLSVGSFFPAGDDGQAEGQGGWGFVGRFGWTAIENKDKDMLLWVAVDFRWQNDRIDGQQVRYRARVNSFGDRQIDTGNIDAESDIRYAFEVAFRLRAIHVSAEFFWATPSVVGGGGAWEVALQSDSTDRADSGVNGGEMDSLSAGVNWYWNPNARVMLTYVYTDITDGPEGTGKLNYVLIRWQTDF